MLVHGRFQGERTARWGNAVWRNTAIAASALRYCRDGVWELRIDTGPGYRVYYAQAGHEIILLLGGGDKGSQSSDIHKAVICWRDWQRRE